jgi:hypothetical protein
METELLLAEQPQQVGIPIQELAEGLGHLFTQSGGDLVKLRLKVHLIQFDHFRM